MYIRLHAHMQSDFISQGVFAMCMLICLSIEMHLEKQTSRRSQYYRVA